MKIGYRVRIVNAKYYPEKYDDALGWVGYKVYADFLSFDTETEAWNHICENLDSLNVSCD